MFVAGSLTAIILRKKMNSAQRQYKEMTDIVRFGWWWQSWIKGRAGGSASA